MVEVPGKTKDMRRVNLPESRLTVLEYAGVDNHRRAKWKCRCVCGNTVVADGGSLRSGNTRSCGCLHLDSIKTHGMSKNTPEYRLWRNMLDRCLNPKSKDWAKYGGRGIKVAEQWIDFNQFYAYVGKRPSDKHTLDRWPNNDGHYQPGNVRWATRTQQMRNTRVNRLITYKGVTRCATEWAELLKIDPSTVLRRLRSGLPVELVLFVGRLSSVR